MNNQLDENNDLPDIQHAENSTFPSIERAETESYDDAIDSKEFQKELMSKVFPSSEENLNVLAEKGVDNNSISDDRLDIQNTILNRQLEDNDLSNIQDSVNGALPNIAGTVTECYDDFSNIQDSVNGTLPNIEGTVTERYDDIIDSKDFQKELMSKVFPSEENLSAIAATGIDSNAIPNDKEGYQTYLDNINKTGEVGDNVDSSESKHKKHKKNKDKDKSKKEKKDNKRKSNLVPLDAFFLPSDVAPSTPVDLFKKSCKKKKGNNDIPSQLTPRELTSNEFSNVPDFVNISVKQEEITLDIKEEGKEDLEEGEIEEEELEEGELRELEEGELPEDIEMIDASRHMSVITKSIPIDFDEFNRKRKVALLLAYCGAGFHGMQKNPEVETIELRLMEALAAIRAIRPDLKNEFLLNNNNQLSFNRAARTDKGVSAARQVVSLKLIANENFLVDVNRQLPKEIRVFGIERVTKTFDAKCSCSGRSYEYLVPTVAFAPSKEIMDSTYRLSDEQFDKINLILGKYLGTHNFHNFTSGKRFSDKSAIRYITDFQASKPFECRGHEFISLEVQGQSFLIHQIRKMIGLCMAICRGYCAEDTVEKSWMEAKLDIPKAPGLGLLLNRVNFKSYNKKYGSDGRHNPLTWENAELEVERYKIEYLWHTIIEEEIKKSSLVHWLKTLNNHTYTEAGMNAPMNSDYKGKKGVFPSLRDKRRYDPVREGPGYDPRREGPPTNFKR